MRTHHLLYERAIWDAHRPNKELRAKHGLRIPMRACVELELHDKIKSVPVPNYRLGAAILDLYVDSTDHLEAIDNLLQAIDQATSSPTNAYSERQLGGMFISVIEQQLPFILDGMIHVATI